MVVFGVIAAFGLGGFTERWKRRGWDTHPTGGGWECGAQGAARPTGGGDTLWGGRH